MKTYANVISAGVHSGRIMSVWLAIPSLSVLAGSSSPLDWMNLYTIGILFSTGHTYFDSWEVKLVSWENGTTDKRQRNLSLDASMKGHTFDDHLAVRHFQD